MFKLDIKWKDISNSKHNFQFIPKFQLPELSFL